MSRYIVTVAGSPSPTSRSSAVARAVAAHTEKLGIATRAFSLSDFNAEDVLLGRVEGAQTRAFLETVAGAAALVLSTPVYKATYTGALKAIVDLLPYEGLVSRPVLGIATTRLEAHVAGVSEAYRALFAFFRSHAVDPLVILDSQIRIEGGDAILDEVARARVAQAAAALAAAIVV